MMHGTATGVLVGMLALLAAWGCGSDDGAGNGGASSGSNGTSGGPPGPTDGTPTVPPVATCTSAGGTSTVATPQLLRKLVDEKEEGWLASPAIVDLDGDGRPEIIAARGGYLIAWHSNGDRVFAFDTQEDRIWASPVIGNFTGDARLEIAISARQKVFLLDATGKILPGFPKSFGSSEARTLAAGDLDGDGALDIVLGNRNGSGNSSDIVTAFRANGDPVSGFPPFASGSTGCPKDLCFMAGIFDQNLAIGDLDGDGKQDVILPMDNAYAAFLKGSGVAFDSNAVFAAKRPKTPGIRYLHNLETAKQGFPDEDTELQAHFTNTPPAIADINKDGTFEIVMVGSVQTSDQRDRLKGVGLWVIGSDAGRRPGWEAPFHVPAYVMGVGDGFSRELDGDAISGAENLVGLTNQVTVADIDPSPGLEMIFAGYDGKIHAVTADKRELWATAYAENGRALTGGVVVADLSSDGAPEIVFTTYSPDAGGGSLFIFSATGRELHKIGLPTRGSMAVPTIGDADGNGVLDIVVSLKNDRDQTSTENVLLYEVPGSKPNCVLWPTGRANYLRNGWVR